jgi:AhpD family alkylhydroperoxidase
MAELQLPRLESQSADEAARAALEEVKGKYGVVPNVYRAFANAPRAVHAYLGVSEQLEATRLSATKRNVVLRAASRDNGCRYCVAVQHAATASRCTARLGDIRRTRLT